MTVTGTTDMTMTGEEEGMTASGTVEITITGIEDLTKQNDGHYLGDNLELHLGQGTYPLCCGR